MFYSKPRQFATWIQSNSKDLPSYERETIKVYCCEPLIFLGCLLCNKNWLYSVFRLFPLFNEIPFCHFYSPVILLELSLSPQVFYCSQSPNEKFKCFNLIVQTCLLLTFPDKYSNILKNKLFQYTNRFIVQKTFVIYFLGYLGAHYASLSLKYPSYSLFWVINTWKFKSIHK